ncbi:MAG: D-amino acid dehydrogenase [Kaiparowitsia implicata GSE-PSE-MK54-09C]|jgi:D-amino-acid dehydrogenase|nr:D-amino acid dehydrogenase [Kaiparowitsia implicata GSE-PSE-MK54-09C]
MRIAVIGGGVIGLTTAFALVRQGHQVELIEQRDEVALETSFANGGQLSYRYVSPLADAGVPLQALSWMLQSDSPLRFRPSLSPHQWGWCLRFLMACRRSVNQRNGAHLLRLALYSQTVLQDWRENQGLENFAWRANGKLVIYRSIASLHKACAGVGDSAHQRLLDANQCIEVEPALAGQAGRFQGGIFASGDEVGDCYLFCQQLLRQLLCSSLFRLHTGQQVSGISIERGRVRAVALGSQEMAVDHLVIAAGIGSVALLRPLGLRLPLYPLKGYSLTLPLSDGVAVPETNVTDYDNKVVYARLGDRLRVAAMVDIGGWDANPDAGRIAALKALAQASFPDVGDYASAMTWAGMRPATPAGTPLLGASGIDNLWLNVGHGSLGFTLACGSAEVLACLISQQQPDISLEGLKLAS